MSVLLTTGCAPYGVIYSNTVIPYSKQFLSTPTGSKKCEISTHQVREPVTGYNISTEWTSAFITNEARKAGIEKINYIDKQTISVLFGIYRMETLIIHGD